MSTPLKRAADMRIVGNRVLAAGCLLFLLGAVPVGAEFEHFITVDGTTLMDGDEPFRFIAFNVPTLLYVEDEMAFDSTNPYGLPTEYGLRDLFETVVETGGQVVRAYTIPVRNRAFPEESVTYVEAPGVFNEEAFRAMDLAIALAGEYGVRLVIPLVNNWPWMGGRPNYAEFRGKESDEFWTDPELIADFKATIDYVLNRKNTITGVVYKDDKTIMAWETGNELQNTAEWAIEIGRYIKRIDSRHLLIDGFHAIHQDGHDVWVQQYSIDEPAFDLINTHHYETSPIATVDNLKKTVAMIDGEKPVFLGEFGFISTSGIEQVLDYVIAEERIPGALVWSLRRHHKDGGFYHHSEPAGHGYYRAYHWPGFADGVRYDEKNALALIRRKAFEIQGKPVPPVSIPKAPQLLPFGGAPAFSWRGSMGASGYDVERSTAATGPWRQIAYNVDDVDTPGFPLFSDETAIVGESYFYRVRARNAAGVSAPSNVVGPVAIEYLTRTDKARNLGVLLESAGVSVESGDYRSFKEAYSRLHGGRGSHVVYTAPGELLEIRLYAFEKDLAANLSFSTSVDGTDWEPVDVSTQHHASDEKNYAYLVPVRYRLVPDDSDAKYVKAEFAATADIVRVEIDYRHQRNRR